MPESVLFSSAGPVDRTVLEQEIQPLLFFAVGTQIKQSRGAASCRRFELPGGGRTDVARDPDVAHTLQTEAGRAVSVAPATIQTVSDGLGDRRRPRLCVGHGSVFRQWGQSKACVVLVGYIQRRLGWTVAGVGIAHLLLSGPSAHSTLRSADKRTLGLAAQRFTATIHDTFARPRGTLGVSWIQRQVCSTHMRIVTMASGLRRPGELFPSMLGCGTK